MGYASSMTRTESIRGNVVMADGTRREAYRNTYRDMVQVDGGISMREVTEIRVEFRLFGNVNNARGNGWRKASDKQAATFMAA
jgi:hypothetical protein